jgi:hypothetical protein
MADIKLLVFNNGLQLVGKLLEANAETGKVRVEKPVQLIFLPADNDPQGRVNMAYAPFLQYTEEWKTGVAFSISDVLSVATPAIELVNKYSASFGSGLILPTDGGVVSRMA